MNDQIQQMQGGQFLCCTFPSNLYTDHGFFDIFCANHIYFDTWYICDDYFDDFHQVPLFDIELHCDFTIICYRYFYVCFIMITCLCNLNLSFMGL